MIDFYTWKTPNGYKVCIMLEEIGVPYNLIPIDIGKDEQFSPDFLEKSPNNKIPAIVDHDTGISLFESGAILLYLAEKTDKLIPKDNKNKFSTIQWLMWQMGGFGPMLGQLHHFLATDEKENLYAKNRYTNETKRLYGVLDKELSKKEYIACDTYTIADIAIFPWVARRKVQKIDLEKYPNVNRWYQAIRGRDTVGRAFNPELFNN